jgi:hypothetical protein
MTTLQAAIPDDLHEAVLAQAERQHVSERAARGNGEDFDPEAPVFTLDSDFRVYRRNKRQSLPLICP